MNQIGNACTKLRPAVIAVSISIVLAIPAAAQPVQIVFDLSADAEAVALQFDVMPHAGPVELSAPQFNGTSPHVVESAVVSSGATRYVVYSTSGRSISPSGTVRGSFTSSVPLRDGMIHIVNVLASDRHGNEVQAQPNSLPVLVTDPPAYRSAELAASITLQAPVVDLDGAIASVQYYIDGASIGATAIPPFAVPFAPVGPGLFTLSAQATDNLGRSGLFDLGAMRAYLPTEFTGYSTFAEIHYGAGTLLDFFADPLGIGIPGGVAYLLGINPHEPYPSRLPQFTFEGDPAEIVYRFRRLSAANDILWNVLKSTDLLEWHVVPPSALAEIDLGTGYHQVEVRLPLGPTPPPSLFVNLNVSLP